jgi:hypothetical protein
MGMLIPTSPYLVLTSSRLRHSFESLLKANVDAGRWTYYKNVVESNLHDKSSEQ